MAHSLVALSAKLKGLPAAQAFKNLSSTFISSPPSILPSSVSEPNASIASPAIFAALSTAPATSDVSPAVDAATSNAGSISSDDAGSRPSRDATT